MKLPCAALGRETLISVDKNRKRWLCGDFKAFKGIFGGDGSLECFMGSLRAPVRPHHIVHLRPGRFTAWTSSAETKDTCVGCTLATGLLFPLSTYLKLLSVYPEASANEMCFLGNGHPYFSS